MTARWWNAEDDRPLAEQERVMAAIRTENLVRAKAVVLRDRFAAERAAARSALSRDDSDPSEAWLRPRPDFELEDGRPL